MSDRWLVHEDGAVVAEGPDGEFVTAGALRRRAGAVASRLRAEGADARLIVASGRLEVAALLLGCWEAGVLAVLPPNAAPDTLSALGSAVGGTLGDADAVDEGEAAGCLRPAVETVVLRLWTSGSTGEPVAVDKTVGQLWGETAALASAFGAAGRTVVTVPPHHIYGLLYGLLLPWATGGTFSLDTPLLPATVAARCAGATTLVTVPAHLRALVDVGTALAGLRRLWSSGAPLPADTADGLEVAGVRATEVLGSTETGGIAWRQQATDAVWTALPDVVVSEDGGLLVVQSPWSGGEVRSADRVELEGDGRFRHLGRADDIVKIASRRVSRSAVERAVLAVDGVADAAVLVVDGAGGPRLVAGVVTELELGAVREALRRRLDGVTVPRLVRLVSLPRQANGKLREADLRAAIEGAR